MNLFTRISATLSATAENAVSRLENHDAIAQSVLTEARQAISQARIRHQRMVRQMENIRNSRNDAKQQEQLWTERAQKFAHSDELRALQCLEQRKQCRAQIEQRNQTLQQHEALELQMAKRLKRMQDRLQSLEAQREEMRSRESLAKATKVMDSIEHYGSDGVDAVFERWELTISDHELEIDPEQQTQVSSISLQQELEKEENSAALRAELAEIIVNKEGLDND